MSKAMPADPDKPESRREATAARASVVRQILDIPSMLEKRSLRWFVILLSLVILAMAAGALFYLQRQMMALQADNVILRDKVTNYLLVSNVAMTAAMDRNTTALNENSRVTHRVEQMLDALSAKLR
jgi:hypothetical protein